VFKAHDPSTGGNGPRASPAERADANCSRLITVKEKSVASFSEYGPLTQKLLYGIFDKAWRGLDNPQVSTIDLMVTRQRLTRALLDAADAGERDPEKLRLAALKAI
jgi:hypothetical protein